MARNPWFKILVNTILRFFQPRYAKYKFLLYTTVDTHTEEVLGYGFGWIEHIYD